MRNLRRALTGSSPGNNETAGDGQVSRGRSSSKEADEIPAKAVLPVSLERRELRLEPAVDEGKSGGKGPKKGGGKKGAAGKKGDSPEQPPPRAETPWRCRAFVDLSPLVQAAACRGGGSGWSDEMGNESALFSSAPSAAVAKTNAGDSPLRAELRAPLVLDPPPTVERGADTDDPSEAKGEEAAPAVTAAAEAVGVRICDEWDVVFVPRTERLRGRVGKACAPQGLKKKMYVSNMYFRKGRPSSAMRTYERAGWQRHECAPGAMKTHIFFLRSTPVTCLVLRFEAIWRAKRLCQPKQIETAPFLTAAQIKTHAGCGYERKSRRNLPRQRGGKPN